MSPDGPASAADLRIPLGFGWCPEVLLTVAQMSSWPSLAIPTSAANWVRAMAR
jgi:hypothetical protein